MKSPELINAREVASILGIGVSTLWRNVRADKIPAPIKVGGATRWRVSEIVAWIEAQEVA